MTVIGLCCPASEGTCGFAGTPLRKVLNGAPVATNERFFLGTISALQLAFRRNSIDDLLKVL
jgi:hypothetical protein